MKRLAPVLAVLATLAATSSAAAAEKIHSPAPTGSTYQEDESILFDWAWDNDQYASVIYFADTPNPTDPIWFGTNNTGRPRIRVSDGGYFYFSSNARVLPTKWGITPGSWWWRLCSKTVDGEDDKCSYRDQPHPITITAKPQPAAPAPVPVPVPSPTPAPTPAPAPPAAPAAPEKAPHISKTAATSYAKQAINRKFLYRHAPQARRITCKPISSSAQSCRSSWLTARYRYTGKVRIYSKVGDDSWYYSMDLVRTDRKSGSKRTIKVT